ncbi:MAG: lysophospholipid acyltransferase family protein [Gammaproteobacteria bacterium]
MKQPNLSYQGSKLVLYFRSVVLFLTMFFSTLIFSPMVVLCGALPFAFRYKLTTLWVDLNLWTARHVCRLDYEIEGLENLPPDKNLIILSKHQSAWETIAFRRIFPPHVFVLKRELLWLPFWGWAMRMLKPIAINRSTQKAALRALVKQGTARLEEGLSVIIFPEGTRVAPGKKRKFNAGGCLLAQISERPVIPVALNSGEFWPRYGFLKYPGTIKVRIGPVIESKGRKAHEINAEVEAWINGAMAEISDFD